MSEQALRISNLKAGYRQEVLHGVSLDVRPGTVVAVVGPSGAGKSTLLRSVSGLVRISGGSITLDGSPITGLRPYQIAKSGIAHVPEGRRVIAPMSVEENLKVAGAATLGSVEPKDLNRIYHVFEPLARLRHQLAGSLSGGEQQMLAIGRAMICRPRFVLLDEPSMGLAPIMIRQVYQILANVTEYFTGAGILLAEQSATLALQVAAEVHVLSLGKIVKSGNAADGMTREEIINSYLGLMNSSSPDSTTQSLPAGGGPA